jgi:hypothetical protein
MAMVSAPAGERVFAPIVETRTAFVHAFRDAKLPQETTPCSC